MAARLTPYLPVVGFRRNQSLLACEGLQFRAEAVGTSVEALIELVQLVHQVGCGRRHKVPARSGIHRNRDFRKYDVFRLVQELERPRLIESHQTIFDQVVIRAGTVEENLLKPAVVDLILKKGERVIKLLVVG
jgi:hypothetical protein